MSMKNADMPAMPVHDVMEDCGIDGNSGPFLVTRTETGLTKREYLAGLAMQGLLAGVDQKEGFNYRTVADDAVCSADALLAELEKEPQP